jgi:Tfp pilus assembly protein PilF
MIKIKQKTTGKTKGKLQSALKYQQAGNLLQAELIYKEILRRQPNNSHVYSNLGFISKEKRQPGEAIIYYRKAIELNPNLSDAHYNLGVIFQEQGKLVEAITCYQQALLLNPTVFAYLNLGSVYQEQEKLDEAVGCYQQAIQLDPEYFKAYNNLGLALREKMLIDQSISSFRKALEMDMDFADAHANMAGALLLKGNYEEGWKEFEWRKKIRTYRPRNFRQPFWDASDISGRTILIYNEAEARGFGDTIQFIRYVPLIARRGAKVIVECQKELVSLLKDVEGVYEMITEGDRLPDFSVHCQFLSLPFIFHTTLENIPAKMPYIQSNPLLVQKWRQKIQRDNAKFKVGLVWAADPKHERFKNRTCPLDMFVSLQKNEKTIFYSLQKGTAGHQAGNAAVNMKLVDLTEDISDFSDTAALIQNLDLIISIDSAVAHLSGALGKPVWTLLPFSTDGRWLLERADSPWYPTMRLFRQPSPGDWDVVISEVSVELDKNLHTSADSL